MWLCDNKDMNINLLGKVINAQQAQNIVANAEEQSRAPFPFKWYHALYLRYILFLIKKEALQQGTDLVIVALFHKPQHINPVVHELERRGFKVFKIGDLMLQIDWTPTDEVEFVRRCC